MISSALMVLAGVWRFVDGRGWPPVTIVRNLVGLAVASLCAWWGLGLTWQAGVCAVAAWLCLVAGYTDWPNWRVSYPRYGLPTAAIAAVAYVGGAELVPLILYGLGGTVAATFYVVGQGMVFKWAESAHPEYGGVGIMVIEFVAGAVVIGGLAWL